MPISSLLSFKLIFISTSLLSAAVALKLSAPAIADFAVTEVPTIYNGVVSWLRPPYLYLVINCIIITIVASSKLQSKLQSPAPPPPLVPVAVLPPNGVVFDAPPVALAVPLVQQIVPPREYFDDGSSGVVFAEAVGVPAFVPPPEPVSYEYGDSFNDLNRYEDKSSPVAESEFVSAEIIETVNATPPEVEIDVSIDEFSVSKSSLSPPGISHRNDSSEFQFPVSSQKPPASSRFGHRRSIKSSPEGGKAAALGVSKPKRQDTLETTWKTITEGRAMPLTRHLRKSDTWEREAHHSGSRQPHDQRMTKSETFNEEGGVGERSLQRAAGGSGKLKKEASLGQDELNKRVEAFIKKFNEDMRLQRQESLNRYREMINRGAH